MYPETISLSSIDAVKKFVCIANEYDFTINLLSDKYKIDAIHYERVQPGSFQAYHSGNREECRKAEKVQEFSFDSFPAVQIDFFPARRLSGLIMAAGILKEYG